MEWCAAFFFVQSLSLFRQFCRQKASSRKFIQCLFNYSANLAGFFVKHWTGSKSQQRKTAWKIPPHKWSSDLDECQPNHSPIMYPKQIRIKRVRIEIFQNNEHTHTLNRKNKQTKCHNGIAIDWNANKTKCQQISFTKQCGPAYGERACSWFFENTELTLSLSPSLFYLFIILIEWDNLSQLVVGGGCLLFPSNNSRIFIS